MFINILLVKRIKLINPNRFTTRNQMRTEDSGRALIERARERSDLGKGPTIESDIESESISEEMPDDFSTNQPEQKRPRSSSPSRPTPLVPRNCADVKGILEPFSCRWASYQVTFMSNKFVDIRYEANSKGVSLICLIVGPSVEDQMKVWNHLFSYPPTKDATDGMAMLANEVRRSTFSINLITTPLESLDFARVTHVKMDDSTAVLLPFIIKSRTDIGVRF
jgi:hypothetical protein